MLFIWSGWGIVVIPVALGTAVAAATWIVGRRLNTTPPRALIDPATNARVLLRRRHTLFWVPAQYWSVPVALAAFVPLLALRTL
jgi:hypothetical protein